MNIRKAIFIIAGMAVLTACSLFDMNVLPRNTSTPTKIADGTGPLPPIPPGRGSLFVV
jgi:hypothetical protein